MAKRKKLDQVDILSEAQNNSKWFFGRRRYISWTQMTEAEWYQFRRSLLAPNARDWILAIIFLIVCAILVTIASIAAFRNSGFSYAAVFVSGMAILVWTMVILHIKRFFRKD